MEMRAREDVESLGQDLTPPLPPLAFSLHDASLLSHCSSCFSPLPTNPFSHHSLLYCSPHCSQSDSLLHLSSAEHLLRGPAASSSDLRAALRLLRRLELLDLIPRSPIRRLDRIGGLMCNRDKLMSGEDDDVWARVRDGAEAMAKARQMRDGFEAEVSGECVLEEAALCAVLTNAVEVQLDGGQALGIAVYDTTFSWINHSCSPNACYWFSRQDCSCCDLRLRIVPAITGSFEVTESGGCNKFESTRVGNAYGPRIIVRSIRAINKGEEVSVAYTDLLQPKAVRQSELWLKYRFICSCQRCCAWPPTYVDHMLQEIYAVNYDGANSSFVQNFHRKEALENLSDRVDDAVAEYLTLGNPKSCCEKLENLLIHGNDGQFESKKEKEKQQYWLHPLHHLSLSAYTTLASAYKTCATDLLALDPEMDKHLLEAFDMSRTGSAYSLLLAGATHHLFLSESSLILSVAKFWTSAGESLIDVARSPAWKLLAKQGLAIAELSSPCSYKFCKCVLVEKFGADFAFSQSQSVVLEDISREFLSCIRNITPQVWNFLIHQDLYLKLIKDPLDFRWHGATNSYRILGTERHVGESDSEGSLYRGEEHIWINQENILIFRLGVHCLLYGGLLSYRFCGK
ncbi:protein SET DOMAIN GROUP 41 [Diospyros lotus]|uniref:protein SET DOMAIN GROUP 41 n=1 Tax=Diospyros lotus TaxID=55363 RepID=UPI002253DF6D|nr:protein SET DOMAIN GROUP 41 [Diospyros lotus]